MFFSLHFPTIYIQFITNYFWRKIMELELLEEKMVSVEIELYRSEIVMFLNCIEAAIDTKHVIGKDLKRAKEIKQQFCSYL